MSLCPRPFTQSSPLSPPASGTCGPWLDHSSWTGSRPRHLCGSCILGYSCHHFTSPIHTFQVSIYFHFYLKVTNQHTHTPDAHNRHGRSSIRGSESLMWVPGAQVLPSAPAASWGAHDQGPGTRTSTCVPHPTPLKYFYSLWRIRAITLQSSHPTHTRLCQGWSVFIKGKSSGLGLHHSPHPANQSLQTPSEKLNQGQGCGTVS